MLGELWPFGPSGRRQIWQNFPNFRGDTDVYGGSRFRQHHVSYIQMADRTLAEGSKVEDHRRIQSTGMGGKCRGLRIVLWNKISWGELPFPGDVCIHAHDDHLDDNRRGLGLMC